jgi:hypothetical protein
MGGVLLRHLGDAAFSMKTKEMRSTWLEVVPEHCDVVSLLLY